MLADADELGVATLLSDIVAIEDGVSRLEALTEALPDPVELQDLSADSEGVAREEEVTLTDALTEALADPETLFDTDSELVQVISVL